MAKWYPGSLIAGISGRLGEDVYYRVGSSHRIRKHVPHVSQPNTPRQMTIRGLLSNQAGRWFTLPNSYKEMWRKYASMSSHYKVAFNAFLGHNMRLLVADHPDLVQIDYPALTPGTPRFCDGFTIIPTNSVTNTISWTAPLNTKDYTQAFYCLDYSYAANYNKHWVMIQTVRSDVGQIVHTHSYAPSVTMYYHCRTIDKIGRISPVTHTIESTVPS